MHHLLSNSLFTTMGFNMNGVGCGRSTFVFIDFSWGKRAERNVSLKNYDVFTFLSKLPTRGSFKITLGARSARLFTTAAAHQPLSNARIYVRTREIIKLHNFIVY